MTIFQNLVKLKRHFLKAKRDEKSRERFANYIIRNNYPDFFSKLVIIDYHEPKKWRKKLLN